MRKLDPEVYVMGEEGRLLEYRGPGGDVVLPGGIRSVSPHAFEGRSDIVSIRYPASVRRVELGSFSGCSGLRKIILSASVARVYPLSFGDCPNLEEIEISAANRWNRMVNGAMVDREKQLRFILPVLTQLPQLPSTVTEVGGYAFQCMPRLTSALLPDQIGKLGPGLFLGCQALEEVRLPEHLQKLPQHTFIGCSRLRSISFPPKLEKIGKEAFAGCGFRSLAIPPSVLQIDCRAFQNNPMTELTIPTLMKIASDAFDGCSVTHVTLTGPVRALDQYVLRSERKPVWSQLYDTFWNQVTHLLAPDVSFRDIPVWLEEPAFRTAAERRREGLPVREDLERALLKTLKRERRKMWREAAFLYIILEENFLSREEILECVEEASQMGNGEITAALGVSAPDDPARRADPHAGAEAAPGTALSEDGKDAGPGCPEAVEIPGHGAEDHRDADLPGEQPARGGPRHCGDATGDGSAGERPAGRPSGPDGGSADGPKEHHVGCPSGGPGAHRPHDLPGLQQPDRAEASVFGGVGLLLPGCISTSPTRERTLRTN